MTDIVSSNVAFALTKVQTHLHRIMFKVEGLEEKELTLFRSEIEKNYKDSTFWKCVADYAAKMTRIQSVRRTKTGPFVATASAWRNTGPHSAESIWSDHVHGATYDEAAEQGRQLVISNLSWFGPGVRFEVEILSALEWAEEIDVKESV